MMAQAGASMVRSRLPSLNSGRRRSFAAFERTNTMRAGKLLEAVGPHFIKSTSSTSTASGTSIGNQARCVRASRKSCFSASSCNRCAMPVSPQSPSSPTKTPLADERGRKTPVAGASALLHGPNLLHVRTEVTQQVFDAVAQRGRRTWTSRAGAAHMQEHHAILVAVEDDVAAIVGDSGPHAGVEQLFDGFDRVLVFGTIVLGGGAFALTSVGHGWSAGDIVVHDGAEDGRLDVLPLLRLALGNRNEIGPQEDAGDPLHIKQPEEWQHIKPAI